MIYRGVILLSMLCSLTSLAGQKIVSMDICTDYYLALFDQTSQAMLSHQSLNFDALQIQIDPQAAIHHNRLEEIMAFDPDVMLQTSLSTSRLTSKIQKYVHKNHSLPWATNMDQLKLLHQQLDDIFGTKKSQKLNQMIDEIWAQRPQKRDQNLLILGSGGFTVKQGHHYDMIFDILGLHNYHQQKGYGSIALETIVQNPPDYIMIIGYDKERPQMSDMFLRHRIFKSLKIPTFYISNPLIVCPSMALIHTAQQLQQELIG